MQYYAMERLLYRLSTSPHAGKFVLKGALLLNVWGMSRQRPTRDIDLLGQLPNQVPPLVSIVQDVCAQVVEPDGLAFDADSVAGTVIKEDADYEGVRITFRGTLQRMRIPMQIDVGFGDVVFPAITVVEYPVILGQTAPRLRCYSRETVIAEKFEAMVKLGFLNSRMKDFYDVWALSRQFEFEGAVLATAIEKTFARRGTPLTREPTAFSPEFAADKAKIAQWRGFLRKSNLTAAPADLVTVTGEVSAFLTPPAAALMAGIPFAQTWKPNGPWI